uniref:Uncharacterized protein n=1 Tax=Lepeophtheirus salmonis TaxID=72036 RepID=A0A0K2UGA8_LEPSM
MATTISKVNHINWELRLILQEEFKNIFSMKNLVTNEDFKACFRVEKWFFDCFTVSI